MGEIIPRMLSTVLKYLARCFTSEALEAKLQILNTTAKVCVKLFSYYYMKKADFFFFFGMLFIDWVL